MFDDIRPTHEEIRGIRNDEAKEEARSMAPSHCQNCNLIELGVDRDDANIKVTFPRCDIQPDGIVQSPKYCLEELTSNNIEMCIECDNIADCHCEDEPEFNNNNYINCKLERAKILIEEIQKILED
jgi:hypothetical protein